MGEIIFKELVAVKTNGEWFYTIDRSLTDGQPTTIENIRTIINNEYSLLGLVSIHETDKEIFIISNQPIPCKNC